jgi:hypothetical protein
MELSFEHDFQNKYMVQRFIAPTKLGSKSDVTTWRSQWTKELSKWHAPYKVLVDARQLEVSDLADVKEALELMIKFFQGFFLRKICAFGLTNGNLPFENFATEEEAWQCLGLRQPKSIEPLDLRSAIQLQNHFQQHVIELGFAHPVVIKNKDDVQVLRSKLQNNLMQWHSKWSLLIDCTNLTVDGAATQDLERLLKVLKGFFMKDAVGYGAKDGYPFPTYRSRHRAAGILEGEGNFSGDAADCKSKSTAK